MGAHGIRKILHMCGSAGILSRMPENDFHREHRGHRAIGIEQAASIAEMVGALANPPRVALLYALREGGEMPVGELAQAAGVTASAASQQLRVLRHLRFVVSRREGRSVVYALHDSHVAALLDEIYDHAEHARLGWASPPAGRPGERALERDS